MLTARPAAAASHGAIAIGGVKRFSPVHPAWQANAVAIAPDGSPVALYLALPGHDEANLIHRAVPPHAPILELGCGVGRVSRHLSDLGHPVTGVDNSEAMLAELFRADGVETVRAELSTLDLSPRVWAVVVMASRLINDTFGPVFLAAAARHLAEGGILLVERHEPGWIDAAAPRSWESSAVSLRLVDVEHAEAGVLRAVMVYDVDGRSYRQHFVAHEVDDDRLHVLAGSMGLRVLGFLDGRRTWAVLGSDG